MRKYVVELGGSELSLREMLSESYKGYANMVRGGGGREKGKREQRGRKGGGKGPHTAKA